MQLSIIIVNYNVKYFLEQCLYSVIEATKTIEAEIFVFDNNSSDGSQEYLSNKFCNVSFIWNNENIGFGKANNICLAKSSGSKILFLNPDAIVPEDCFAKCLTFFKNYPACGAMGIRMIDGSARYLPESKRAFPSLSASFYKMIGLAKIFPKSKIFASYYSVHVPQNKTSKTDVLSGAFMMLDSAAAKVCNGFDEDYFMYAEDIDLSYRIQKFGFENYYFADTTIIHFKGESTKKSSKFYINHFYGAMLLFVRKHYQPIAAAIISLFIISSKYLLIIKNYFSKKSNNLQTDNFTEQTIIVANSDNYNRLVKILSTKAINILGRVGEKKSENDFNFIGNYSELENIMSEKNVTQIIFCQPDISYKKTMEIIESIGYNKKYLFHNIDSKSIVGSNDKNSNGIFIPLQ